ncbi:ScyD/ScyE family protein [Asanoa sp. WMMD1127]|uniref:ScyD/ScyE family protein n=1 Tax=Asanoa sp. WMMD1127 TaxID=3016107 RepID=UPI002417DF96|nr:ScyD/ScyE family protein [Asanoa sp. WMMD1127]MDG4821877.1 ScyD/ScyE family protein [Asanoa sp. WMMD1127]
MRLHRFAAAVVGALAVTMLAPAVANAAPMNNRPWVVTVARGLDNPRGVTIGYNGAVVLAEAGRGGRSDKCLENPEGGRVCLGLTGALTSVTQGRRGWTQQRIVGGLPSLAGRDGAQAVGPHDVSPYGGNEYAVALGLGGTPQSRFQLGIAGLLLGQTVLARSDRNGRSVRSFGDPAAFEGRRDPDRQGVDSNPYSILGTRGGAVAVDAGGNTLLNIDRRGQVSTAAVFPNRPARSPNGDPVSMQAVPTSVVRGPDGAFYVGQLTGFPFPAGGANVYRVVPGQRPTVFARGFTNIVDLAFDRQGRLLVLQISRDGLATGDQTGALIRVNRRGQHVELVPGRLTAPGGLAVAGDGSLWVTNRSTSAGRGELLRISNV